MGGSITGGTPKSSTLTVFSLINHPFSGSPILGNPLYRNIRNGLKVVWDFSQLIIVIDGECIQSCCFIFHHIPISLQNSTPFLMGPIPISYGTNVTQYHHFLRLHLPPIGESKNLHVAARIPRSEILSFDADNLTVKGYVCWLTPKFCMSISSALLVLLMVNLC